MQSSATDCIYYRMFDITVDGSLARVQRRVGCAGFRQVLASVELVDPDMLRHLMCEELPEGRTLPIEIRTVKFRPDQLTPCLQSYRLLSRLSVGWVKATALGEN